MLDYLKFYVIKERHVTKFVIHNSQIFRDASFFKLENLLILRRGVWTEMLGERKSRERLFPTKNKLRSPSIPCLPHLRRRYICPPLTTDLDISI